MFQAFIHGPLIIELRPKANDSHNSHLLIEPVVTVQITLWISIPIVIELVLCLKHVIQTQRNLSLKCL